MRQRGRIKTERKLLPVQKKLEREVVSLKQNITKQEFVIREAARKRVKENLAAGTTETVIPLRERHNRTETIVLNREHINLAPERRRPSHVIAPPEHIGHMIIAAESVTAESLASTPEATAKMSRRSEQQVETLSRNELLTLSEKVIVEGSTLRQVYETNLISERGLRRLITEYLRGGDVVRAFRRELVEREIDFERDPKLRDAVRKNLKSSGGASPTLQRLLAQAGVSTDDQSVQDIARARADQLREAKQESKRESNRRIVDLSLITIIAVLLAVIIVLAIRKA